MNAIYSKFIDYFVEHNFNAKTELNYNNDFELLIAVILSAQCTDKRVNLVTPILFKKFPDIETTAKASISDVYELIKSISYPNSKAEYIVNTAILLETKFNSKVPNNEKDLQSLPGVGRKTANVILSVLFDKPAMAVDTHVFRVSKRLGLTNDNDTILSTEKKLIQHIPQEYISKAHHWLILHGRYICTARKPNCLECGLNSFCKKFQQENQQHQ